MKRIGLLSDTHGHWDGRMAHHLAGCDELWHAGDIGSPEVIARMEELCPVVRAVTGNVDGRPLTLRFPKVLRFACEEASVLITHIGGYPGRYDPRIRAEFLASPPGLFVSGHSHILKVMHDPRLRLLHINPGAAGLQGWHQVRTLVRLTIDGRDFRDLEVVEL